MRVVTARPVAAVMLLTAAGCATRTARLKENLVIPLKGCRFQNRELETVLEETPAGRKQKDEGLKFYEAKTQSVCVCFFFFFFCLSHAGFVVHFQCVTMYFK